MYIYNQFSLKSFHTLAIRNVTANGIIVVQNIQHLIRIWSFCKKNNIPFLILGQGSNTVFLENYAGIIILNRIKGITIYQNKAYWKIHIHSGEKWHELVKYTLKIGIFGLENLAFIPGYLGSAIIQNIGAFDVEMKDICQYVDIFSFDDFKMYRIFAKFCYFSYRNSIFQKYKKNNFAIIAIGLKIKKDWKPVITHNALKKLHDTKISPMQIFHTVYNFRKQHIPNPKIFPNAGSFFKNPIVKKSQLKQLYMKYQNMPYFKHSENTFKLSAGWLIKQCKADKFYIGDAQTYRKRPLIIINKKNASSEEICKLMIKIHLAVQKKFKIYIQPEVQLITKNGRKNFIKILYDLHQKYEIFS